MKPFTVHRGRVAPLDRVNVDTDQIIPKQFLKRIEKTGFGQFLFYDWRFAVDGTKNPDFVLHEPRYQGATILVAGKNFGCGSSREHAVWALADFGLKAVVSTSFADIFRQNSLKNGFLPIVVDAKTHALLKPGTPVTIDLAAQTLSIENGPTVSFPIDSFSKTCILEGLDEIGYILKHDAAISSFEGRS